MKKTDIIELLKRMEESTRIVQKSFEESGNKETAEYYMGQKHAYHMVADLLKDDKFAKQIQLIYRKEAK